MHTSWFEATAFPRLPRQTLSEQLADRLRRQALTGELRPGQKLPAVRRLAELAGVSVPTAREAVQAVCALGLFHTQHGVGTFVTRRRDERRLFTATMRRATSEELAEFAALLDRLASARSARRFARRGPRTATTASLLPLLARDRSAARLNWPEVFTDADTDFHEAVASAAGKTGAFSARLRVRLGRRLRPVLVSRAGPLADDDRLDEQHRALAEAIVSGDERTARRLAALIAEREVAAVG